MVRDASKVEHVVEAVGLTKVFKDFWMRTKARAVDNVDFSIAPREIFGLLGPNGSGKSTIIKMILGLLHKSSGRLLVFGRSPSDVFTKKRIGFLPEESYLYRFLNPRETLDYYGKLFGLDQRTRTRRIDELLDMIGLSQVAHRPIGEFSKGMTRRIGIAQALINDPEFLILDEPTSGLDPIGTRQVKDLILELGRRGKTILLSSHLLSDVEDVCHRVVMLYGGKIRAQGTINDLLADTQHTLIQTPRLGEDTIARIEAILQQYEGKGIERVSAPRQKLEQFFIDLVHKAREEQVATSGATHGGITAKFLRADVTEGAALIKALTEADQLPSRHSAMIMRPDREAISSAATSAQVLKDLTREEPTMSLQRATEAKPAVESSSDVDRAFLESLTKQKLDSEDTKGGDADRAR